MRRRKRVLVDEGLSPRLHQLSDEEFEWISVVYRGWAGMLDGDLLARASREFDFFLTADTKLPAQQPIAKLPITVVILRGGARGFDDLVRYRLEIRRALRIAKVGRPNTIELF